MALVLPSETLSVNVKCGDQLVAADRTALNAVDSCVVALSVDVSKASYKGSGYHTRQQNFCIAAAIVGQK